MLIAILHRVLYSSGFSHMHVTSEQRKDLSETCARAAHLKIQVYDFRWSECHKTKSFESVLVKSFSSSAQGDTMGLADM
jgi:hypothetical protein